MLLELLPFAALRAHASEIAVDYLDEDGVLQTCTAATILTDADTTWSTGWYVVNSRFTVSSRITVSGDVHLILANNDKLTASLGITVSGGNSLTIYGQTTDEERVGQLVADNIAESHSYYAGIGGYARTDTDSCTTGTITINSGCVTAYGSEYGAAIGGGGYQSSGGTVTINGGYVYAYNGNKAGNCWNGASSAAIGGGYQGSCGSVTINGGTVYALSYDSSKGASRGAAIGTGYKGTGGSITINGGVVTAETKGVLGVNPWINEGSAIGNGAYATQTCKVTINGGYVTANCVSGYTMGAAISGDIRILGGIVTAKGGYYTSTGYSAIGKSFASSAATTFSTMSVDGVAGNALLIATPGASGVSAISDQTDKEGWTGVILEGTSGKVYDYGEAIELDPMPENATTDSVTLPASSTLTIPAGSELVIPYGLEVLNCETSTICVNGTLTLKNDQTPESIGSAGKLISSSTGTSSGKIATADGIIYHYDVDENATGTWVVEYKPPEEIAAVSLELVAPVTGEKPMATVTTKNATTYQVTDDGAVWSLDGNELVFGNVFQGGKAYTATVTLTPNEGYVFDDNTAVTVRDKTTGGKIAAGSIQKVLNADDSSLAITVTFPATEAEKTDTGGSKDDTGSGTKDDTSGGTKDDTGTGTGGGSGSQGTEDGQPQALAGEVTGTTVVTQDSVVQSGQTLTVQKGAKLVIEEGADLSNIGQIVVEPGGQVVVQGSLTNQSPAETEGAADTDGQIKVADGATLTVEADATLTNNGTVDNNGALNLHQGAKLASGNSTITVDDAFSAADLDALGITASDTGKIEVLEELRHELTPTEQDATKQKDAEQESTSTAVSAEDSAAGLVGALVVVAAVGVATWWYHANSLDKVEGVARDWNGNVLANATVLVYQWQNGQRVAVQMTQTDGNGMYRIQKPAGDYALIALYNSPTTGRMHTVVLKEYTGSTGAAQANAG